MGARKLNTSFYTKENLRTEKLHPGILPLKVTFPPLTLALRAVVEGTHWVGSSMLFAAVRLVLVSVSTLAFKVLPVETNDVGRVILPVIGIAV